VAGRAGRFFPDGTVVVQSFQPARPAVRLSCEGNAESLSAFYEAELAVRRDQRFPPFSRLIRLVFRSPSQEKARDAAREALVTLGRIAAGENITGVEILGPSDCALEKIAANYRVQLLIRATAVTPMQELCRHLIFGNDYKVPAGVHMEADVDPVGLL
jgi:primosomal protein N' (replication factor Y)